MTCKDCLHYEACKGTYYEIHEMGDFDEEGYASSKCDHFQAKDQFVEVEKGRKKMLEVIYRIYQVDNEETRISHCGFNTELTMDCKICESREHFKELIRAEYGENIKFANSKKLKLGDLYCIIIGEHCYNTERYFNKIEYVCAECGSKVIGYVNKFDFLSNWEIKDELCNQFDKYADLKFCSYRCKQNFIKKERAKCLDDGLIDESFITRNDFRRDDIAGYIYKISKKSTGEFYVGQTIYLPIFRWGQHLKTDRFDMKGILDYQFEVIEIVPKNENILEREKYYIQKFYKENPEKSLNIACTAKVAVNQIEMSEVESDA